MSRNKEKKKEKKEKKGKRMKVVKDVTSWSSLQPVSYDQIEADRIVQAALKKKETKEVTKQFVRDMAPWNTWITNSFRGGRMPLVKAQEIVQNFFKDECDDVTYFTAYELHNNGIGWHPHTLAHLPQHRIDQYCVNVNDGKPKYCRKLWKKMFHAMGRTTIAAIGKKEDFDKITDYCQKHVLDYTTKGDVRGLGVYDYHFGNGEDGRRFFHDFSS